MKLAIIGSRTFDDYDTVVTTVKALFEQVADDEKPSTIISGEAKGADTLAEHYAKEHGLELWVFKPDYQQYARSAAHVRNRLIVDNADMVLAFWNGKSTGTKYTMDYAKRQGKPVKMISVE